VENHVNLLFNYNPLEPSFPSGHAAFYFAIATVVFLYLKKVYPRPKFWRGASILFFIAGFLISISRVFSGIHWPSDILAGAAIGIFSGWLVMFFYRKFLLKV
jgi:undecaprenyl-diphosphatase